MKEVFRPVLKFLQAPTGPIVGGAVVVIALVWFVFTEMRRRQSVVHSSNQTPAGHQGTPWVWLLTLLLLIAVGAILRLLNLDEKTITHPEVYIPGIPLPASISEPPPRLDLATLISWHFFREPHPLGYYLAMFGWTQLFGTGLSALRIPSALLGIFSIPVMFRVGALAYDRTVGLIATGFLALHGLHIYWSQQARMYVPECFLDSLQLGFYLEILRARRPRVV